MRLITGISGGGTDPEVFSQLGDSCRVPGKKIQRKGIFHPKLYIFNGVGGKDIAFVGSMNFTKAGLHRNENQLYNTQEDNLVKGSAGQSVQAMNLLFELPETTGLEQIALVP